MKSPHQKSLPQKDVHPRPCLIEAYGEGYFRFAGTIHHGGILCLPTGIYSWNTQGTGAFPDEDFLPVFACHSPIDLLLIGFHPEKRCVSEPFQKDCQQRKIRYDILPTAMAVRTYNVLLSDGRAVAAALCPIIKE